MDAVRPARWSTLALASLLLAGQASALTTGVGDALPPARGASSAGAVPPGWVTTETQLRAAWADPLRRRIDLGADIVLRDCLHGDPIRESPYALVLDGHGRSLRQSCFEKRVLRQDGTGHLDLRDVILTRGGADGPGAALASRGEVLLSDCVIRQNLAEEAGGGVFSMRRVTVHRCRINGNLANDDGGAVYAGRGGVRVHDSILSANLVDGSGGAVASTGDILVVGSHIDGNTTDGDGGALYADGDGDVTVVDSLIDGSAADGPGGAIFTVDGDVAVLESTVIGNRADDRGGAIAGEADVLVVNSTVARNLAVAHGGGGIWARGSVALVNATVTDNYSEGAGGGVLSAGRTTIISSTLTRNIASVGGDVSAAGTLRSFGSIIGPPAYEGVTGDTIPTRRSCRVYDGVSLGHNFVTDDSCGLESVTDVRGASPMLARLEDDPLGFVLTPYDGSPVRGRIPSGSCLAALPTPLPSGQLLERWVTWGDLLDRDAVGAVRDTGAGCDIGAVQSPPAAPPPLPPPAPEDDVMVRAGSAPRPLRRSSAVPPRSVVRVAAPRRAPGVRDVRDALRRQSARLARLRSAARRFDVLRGCASWVGVDRAGDPRHRWGFLYDERDGTGLDARPALVRHRGSGHPRWVALTLATSRGCLSAPPDPRGSGEDARARPGPPRVGALLRRLHRLERGTRRLARTTRRFEDWESCLTALPVSESGDTEQGLGHLTAGTTYLPGLDLDDSERDDPDYQVLAFAWRDRPGSGRDCDDGDADDRAAAARPREPRSGLRRLRAGLRELREDLGDLEEPVGEITRFDECLYTVGVRERSGFAFRDDRGRVTTRPALQLDLGGASLPQQSWLALPGEEPPQIECRED